MRIVNVLVVFTYGYSLKIWQDSGTLVRELSIYKKLNMLYGVNFTFLTFSECEPDLDLDKYGIKVLPVYKIINYSNNKFINYIKSFLIPFYLKSDLEDITLIKQNQLLGSWISILIKLIYKKPLFIRTGYDMYKFSLNDNKSFFIKSLYKFLTKFSIHFADLYSVSSRDDITFLVNHLNVKKDIQLRQNWVLGGNLLQLDNRKSKNVLSVGRLEEQKNFSGLIKNLENTNFTLDLIGSGSLRDMLAKEASLLNVKVNFIEPLENEKLINLMSTYKYYVSTSNFEGNPKTVLEAMSTGCIVIASDIPNHKEIIDHNLSGLIFEVEKNNLGAILKTLNNKKDVAEKLSQNGFKFVNENFSLEKICKDEHNDYLELSNDAR